MPRAGAWILLVFVATSAALSTERKETPAATQSTSKDWDVLIFTQHWPATVCHQWREHGAEHSCELPSPPDIWTVHGIWPTKLGTVGPAFCNDSWRFDEKQLAPIEGQLEQYWLNIEKDTPKDSLWKHEWMKHGTCAAVLPELNSEDKYFGQGLQWLQKYSMSKVLQQVDIRPNNTFDPQEIYGGVKKILKRNPALECMHDVKTGLSYIFEIRICFDKQLQLTDCDGVKRRLRHLGDGKILTNCDLHKQIIYPDVIESPKDRKMLGEKKVSNGFRWTVLDVYKFVYFLQWFTF